MSRTYQRFVFQVEPVKPRNRVAVEGLKRRGGPHVKPYGSRRQEHKLALRDMIDDDTDILDEDDGTIHALRV